MGDRLGPHFIGSPVEGRFRQGAFLSQVETQSTKMYRKHLPCGCTADLIIFGQSSKPCPDQHKIIIALDEEAEAEGAIG